MAALLLVMIAFAGRLEEAEGGTQGAISVTSTGDGNVRDGEITLREAILLVTGNPALSIGDLDPGECQASFGTFVGTCVQTSPLGSASSDRVVFNAIEFPMGNPATIAIGDDMPPLSSGGDVIEGSFTGVRLEALNGGFPSHTCVHITSDNNAVRGLEITNCDIAILIEGGANNVIGGTMDTSAASPVTVQRNVIHGNDTAVRITDADDNTVIGNYIGLDADGQPSGNTLGVSISSGASNNTIGGSGEGERNVISGNSTTGVVVSLGSTSGNTVSGNYIGTDLAGEEAVPNGTGVSVRFGSHDNTIGGSGDGEGNVISGNAEAGIELISGTANSGNVIQGNRIGTGADGQSPLPNGVGVSIFGGPQENTVGGTGEGEANVIAHNEEEGVRVEGELTTGNTVRGNSIHSNGGPGIDNVDGGNTELPPPEISGFGSVTGTACADCTVDVYSDAAGEGRTWEGSTVADGAGDWTLDVTPGGPFVTATATDSDGNTSEFSAPADPAEEPVRLQGDLNCDDVVDALDALQAVRYAAGVSVSQGPDCEDPGTGGPPPFGDVNCDGGVDEADGLALLMYVGGLEPEQAQPCTAIGDVL